jgi:hypothetical protein
MLHSCHPHCESSFTGARGQRHLFDSNHLKIMDVLCDLALAGPGAADASKRFTTMVKSLLTGSALVIALAAAGGNAHAGGIRVGIGIGAQVRVRVPRVSWPRVHRPIHVVGAVVLAPPVYHPGAAAPAAYPPAPITPLPTWGFGVFAGGVEVDGGPAGDDLGLLARLRLSDNLLVEAEVGKTELAEGARVDRRLGGGLVWELTPRADFSLYGVGAMGVTQAQFGDRWETDQKFGELGLGLRWRATDKLHLAADFRAGARRSDADHVAPTDAAARLLAPVDDGAEQYSRGRLSAIMYF